MKYHIVAIISSVLMILSSCGESKFKIDGEIEGADGQSVMLEKSDFNGNWVVIDSARIGGNGKFSISAPEPASPEIYRLSLGQRYIYMPVDSTEHLKVKTTLEGFGTNYEVNGSPQAELLAAFDKELMSLDLSGSSSLSDFKRNVYTKYIKEGQGSILSYYVLTKIHNGKPLYDPSDFEDAKYYAAVATQFENYRPDDPHGQMVKQVSLEAMKNKNNALGKKNVIRADEIGIIDIELPDASGKTVKLSDIAGKGKKVAVVFSMMNEPESPAFNRELARIYKAHEGSFEIYQISFDAGQYEWREASANLPWINVIDPDASSSTAIRDYNVGALPAIFIYDTKGELIDRAGSINDFEKKIR